MPAVRDRVWTPEEVDRLVDEREERSPRYELVDGELLVTPAPSGRHQRIVVRLLVLLDEYVNRHGIGEVRIGRARLTADSRLEPDLFVVPAVGGRRPPIADSATIDVSLVIEVLSPSSLRHDRFTKRRFFQARGVPVYWIIDPGSESIEIWKPGDERPELTDERVVWRPVGAAGALELDVKRFFAEVRDEEQ